MLGNTHALTMSNTAGDPWGRLSEDFGHYTSKSDYSIIKYEDITLPQYKDLQQAGHCMIYSKQAARIFGIYDPRAAILMQMRFDGFLGFPGGLVHEEESVVCGLNRELVEEINFDTETFSVQEKDYVITHYNAKEKLLLHFYAVEISLKEFVQIEKNALAARDYGTEVMGVVRVPLYTMEDGYRGFPAFLRNAFAGNSFEQLLKSLEHLQIMSKDEINKALIAKPIS